MIFSFSPWLFFFNSFYQTRTIHCIYRQSSVETLYKLQVNNFSSLSATLLPLQYMLLGISHEPLSLEMFTADQSDLELPGMIFRLTSLRFCEK